MNRAPSQKTRGALTAELLEALRKSQTIEAFEREYGNDYIGMSFFQYMEVLLKEKKLKKIDVINKSGLNKVYAYQIFAGIRKPSRDKLLALAYAMKLSYKECQQLLHLANVSGLYIKNRRDSAIIFGLMRGLSVLDINELLYEMGEFILE